MESTHKRKSLLRLLDEKTEAMENFIISTGLLSISVIVFSNVIARYFFHKSFTWSEELARYIIVWVTFFGISSCARYDTHVNVDLIPSMLIGTSKFVHELIVRVISLGLSIYMTYLSINFTKLQFITGNKSIAVAVPIWIIYLSTCIGFGLLSYVYLRKIMILVNDNKKKGED